MFAVPPLVAERRSRHAPRDEPKPERAVAVTLRVTATARSGSEAVLAENRLKAELRTRAAPGDPSDEDCCPRGWRWLARPRPAARRRPARARGRSGGLPPRHRCRCLRR